MPANPSMRLALVDDHTLFRKGLISLIKMVCFDCTILLEADNGKDLQQKISKTNEPDIILMDINMPHMDGFETVQWLQTHFPQVKILVVSMVEKEESILRMLKMGVRGYLSKDVEPAELGAALAAIMNKGFFYTDFITGKLVLAIQNEDTGEITNETALNILNLREKEFLKLACSELTYGEIATHMFLSPKTIDGY